MEHFFTFKDNNDNYAEKITINKYTQGENESKVNKKILKSKNILEIILSLKDYNYQKLESSEKSLRYIVFISIIFFSIALLTRPYFKKLFINSGKIVIKLKVFIPIYLN